MSDPIHPLKSALIKQLSSTSAVDEVSRSSTKIHMDPTVQITEAAKSQKLQESPKILAKVLKEIQKSVQMGEKITPQQATEAVVDRFVEIRYSVLPKTHQIKLKAHLYRLFGQDPKFQSRIQKLFS